MRSGRAGVAAESLLAWKNSLRVPCSTQEIPCSPAQGIFVEALGIPRLFSANFDDLAEIPCLPSARGEFSLLRGAALTAQRRPGDGFPLRSLQATPIIDASTAERAMQDDIPPAGEPESAKVIALVTSIPLAVDLTRYDLTEAAFAPEVAIDYTSLWGGEAQRTTPTR